MSDSLLIHNARVITPQGVINGWLLTREGSIAALGAGNPPSAPAARLIDGQGGWLLPGFIDLHVHGALGHETMDADADGLRAMATFYAAHGVTGFLPTTWTASRESIRAALACVASLMAQPQEGAQILGVHQEGPYLNAAKCGAQDSGQIRRAERDEALEFLDTGVIRLVAVAPEYPENHWLIRECAARGIRVSAAHTNATYDELIAAIPLGLTQTTHTFNAMTGLHHRDPGVVGAALTQPAITCELIADNIHVHPAVMKLVWLAKGADGIVLISDAVRGAGLPEGSTYLQDGRPIVLEGGSVRLPDGTLAGSALTMDAALRNFCAATGAGVEQVWPVTSRNAARQIGLADRKGSLGSGFDADLVLLTPDLTVHTTIAAGRVVFERV